MHEYFQAFLLGNGAILGNVCMLPLYPSLFVLLADRAERGASPRSLRWMGVLVLAGVITVMVSLGALLHALRQPFANVLPYALPVIYGVVFLLGLAMLADRNPLARLTTSQAPIMRSPAASAYLYGLAIGPMTLPCTGPLVISAFVLGSVNGGGALSDSLVYFLFFSLGFGWPLVLLPMLAAPVQQRLTQVLTRHHRAVSVVSGLLLVGLAVFGWFVEIRPN